MAQSHVPVTRERRLCRGTSFPWQPNSSALESKTEVLSAENSNGHRLRKVSNYINPFAEALNIRNWRMTHITTSGCSNNCRRQFHCNRYLLSLSIILCEELLNKWSKITFNKNSDLRFEFRFTPTCPLHYIKTDPLIKEHFFFRKCFSEAFTLEQIKLSSIALQNRTMKLK